MRVLHWPGGVCLAVHTLVLCFPHHAVAKQLAGWVVSSLGLCHVVQLQSIAMTLPDLASLLQFAQLRAMEWQQHDNSAASVQKPQQHQQSGWLWVSHSGRLVAGAPNPPHP